jgi:spore coat polysaccharide biosynthesis protein SpsF
MQIRIFVQARMSSARFPGKMLTPFLGQPLIASVLDALSRDNLRSQIVVLTSAEASDDALAEFVEQTCHVPVFRGDLNDVAGRFQAALDAYPCDWFVRISGDSPLIEAQLVRRMMDAIEPRFDLVTNVKRRTFPPGQSVECVRSAAFAALDTAMLTPAQREHVTPVFYEGSDWQVRSVVCREPGWTHTRMVVDTPDDLRQVEILAATAAMQTVSFASLCEVEGA